MSSASRSRSLHIGLAVLVLYGSGGAQIALAQDDAGGGLALEQAAIAARQAIRSGLLEVRVEDEKMHPPEARVETFRFAFDGENIRLDTIHENAAAILSTARDAPPDAIAPFGTRSLVLRGDTVIMHQSGTLPNGKRLSPTMGSRQELGVYYDQIVEPRLMGLVPMEPLFRVNDDLPKMLGNPDRGQRTLEKVSYEGREVMKSHYVRSDGATFDNYIDPAMNNALLRADGTKKTGDQVFLVRVVSHYEDFGGVWFPREIAYETGVINDQGEIIDLISRQRLTVTNAQFNMEIDPKEFTLATMDVPVGVTINEIPPNPKGTHIWDGEKMISIPRQQPTGDVPPGNRQLALIAISSGLAILVALFAWLYFRGARKNSPRE